MAQRTVYGNRFGENGWPMVDTDSCQWITVPGTKVSLQIQKGQPLAVMQAFAADFNAYVEPLRDADSACWTPTNSVATSNHLSGTAMDLNWGGMGDYGHPFRVRGTFNAEQMSTIRELLEWYEDTIYWGGDWTDPVDEMHWQMGYNTYGNPHVDDFIKRKIRPDGFSTFRRKGVPAASAASGGLTATTLAWAMGGSLPLSRYEQLLPAVRQALIESDCTTLNRVAMWMAQIGTESGGLRWMEEIADGSEYEGRADLGNVNPGDGRRYKGRGPIQVTGLTNYAAVSQWAYDKGLVPSPTFFVNNPQRLADDKYGFMGAVWYWTVARPQINDLCDAGDIEGVTRAINGGLHGIEDRRQRWNNALKLGFDALNPLTAEPDVKPVPATKNGESMAQVPQEQWDRIYSELTKKFPSRSPLRHLNEGLVDTEAGMVLNSDANVHVMLVKSLAEIGDPVALALLAEVAGADLSVYPDRAADAALARTILAHIEATNPAVLSQFLKMKG